MKKEDDLSPEYDFSRGVRGKYAGKDIRVVGSAVGGLSREEAGADEFEEAYDENFSDTLNLDTWTLGEDLAAAFGRLEQEVAEALEKETEYRQRVRSIVFSRLEELRGKRDVPRNAGRWEARLSDLERIHTALLFNGGVEACDGTSVIHDTLPLTITQIGVCLVSYQGQQGSWAHRLFRRDLRAKLKDPVEEVLDLLERREKREGQGQDDDKSPSQLARRGIMAYAERAILREKSKAPWRMGHGSPAPYELLTGLWASKGERLELAEELIRWFVEHKKFVFVPSAPRKRHWLTIGHALRPLEFAIIQTLRPELDNLIKNGGYREESGALPVMKRLRDEVGPEIVIGVYRVWEAAPPFLFYAHVDYAEQAAHIAMADSLLQQHRGFPMLIDLADTVCTATFGVEDFRSSVHTAYADAGEPFRYLGERETRSR
jgi:hypothetical protein